jgi:two-component system, NarL family, nitrate/nitrite response regulator NarL
MAILLITQDRELEARCRRATSAQYAITQVDHIAQAPACIAAAAHEIVLIDAETLQRPYAEKVAAVVAIPGVARVIVMTADFMEDEEVALLRGGVQGVCRRGIDADSLRQVLTVTENGVWVTRSLLPRLVTELRRYAQQAAAAPPPAPAVPPKVPSEKLAALTRRERDIVKRLADGATNKEVAEDLDISERTVKGHLSNIFMKLGVPDRLKLVLYLTEGQRSAEVARK